ncbi:MAG: hypothetical protein ACRESE_02045 [Gammaproteobacteria bacterium]
MPLSALWGRALDNPASAPSSSSPSPPMAPPPDLEGGAVVGGGAALAIATLAEASVGPTAPVQVIEYVVVCIGETLAEPEVPEAVKPVPVQLVTFLEDQVRVEDWPFVIEVGDAERATVGAPLW